MQVLLPRLQTPKADPDELADVRWIHRDWLAAVLRGSSDGTGLNTLDGASKDVVPGQKAFHIPGRWSLAYRLINNWVEGKAGPGTSRAAVQEEWAGDQIPQVRNHLRLEWCSVFVVCVWACCLQFGQLSG